jgi:hypothetical protein
MALKVHHPSRVLFLTNPKQMMAPKCTRWKIDDCHCFAYNENGAGLDTAVFDARILASVLGKEFVWCDL